MKKQMILAACLAMTPFLAIAVELTENHRLETKNPAMNQGDPNDTGVDPHDEDNRNSGLNQTEGFDHDAGINTHERDADNTGVNKRDRDDQMLTPMDQGNNKPDLKMTQDIRQALMDGELSMDAKNIKVITRDGVVTLRGPVKTVAELEEISAMVNAMPGIKRVDNQLQVK